MRSVRSTGRRWPWVLSLLLVFEVVALGKPAGKRTEAARHQGLGASHLAAGRYVEAAGEYALAYQIAPAPGLLFSLGQAHRLAGKPDKALEAYRLFLEQKPKGKSAEEARAHVAALEKEIAAAQAAAVDLRPPPTVVGDQAAVTLQPASPPPRKKTPRWVWGLVGGLAALVVAGAVTGAVLGTTGREREPTLGTMEWR